VDKRVDTLHLATWSAELTTDLVLTRSMVPRSAHDAMVEWCGEKSGRAADLPTNVVLSGLSEIASFLVPETAYMKTERDLGERGPGRLCLYFVGDVSGNDDIRRRIQAGFSVWLGIWGAVIQFQSGQTRTLVPRTPQASPYHGVDLVAFSANKERDGEELWSEVITVSTATFPERKEKGVHLLARPSIRNWGPMQGYDLSADPARSLDLFMPPATGREQGFGQYRHTSFRFKAVVDNWKDVYERGAQKKIVARWESQREQRIFDLIRRLAGAGNLGNADLTKPVIGQEGLWILPQLAPGSGDRDLAGGYGVGWSDRLDIAVSLDAPLRDAGFHRTEPMKRLAGIMPVARPFAATSGKKRGERQAQRRTALRKALEAIGNKNGMLDILIFCIREATPAEAMQELRDYLGAPDKDEGSVFSWADGLKITVVQVASGPLAESFPKVDLTEHEKAGKTDRQQAEIRRVKQAEANTAAAARMRDHVRAAREGRPAIACALVEMPGSLRNKAAEDPYAIARSELASQKGASPGNAG
jgi:hypothetical protein